MSPISGSKRPRPESCEKTKAPQTLHSLPLDLLARIGSYLPFNEAKKLPLAPYAFISTPTTPLEKPSLIFFLLRLSLESTSQLKISTYLKLFEYCKKLGLEDEACILINSIHSGLFETPESQESLPLAQQDSLDAITQPPYQKIVEICLDYGFSKKLLEILTYPPSALLSDETLESIAHHAVEKGLSSLLQAVLKRRFKDPWIKWQLIPNLLLKSVLLNQEALFDELSAHPVIADEKFPKGLLAHAVQGARKSFILELLKKPLHYEIDSEDIAQSLTLAIQLNREDILYELLFHKENTAPIKGAFLQACTSSSWAVLQKILLHPLKATLNYSDLAKGCRLLAKRAELSSLISLIHIQTGSWGGLFASSIDEWILLIAQNKDPDLKKRYSTLFRNLLHEGLFYLSTDFFYKLLTRAIENPCFPKEEFDFLWKSYFAPSSIPLETYFYFCNLSFLHHRKELRLWEIDPRFTLSLFAKWCEKHKGAPQSDRFIVSQLADL